MKLKVRKDKIGANDAIEGYGIVPEEGRRIALGATDSAIR